MNDLRLWVGGKRRHCESAFPYPRDIRDASQDLQTGPPPQIVIEKPEQRPKNKEHRRGCKSIVGERRDQSKKIGSC
ncbi:MAG: hypothetical protein A3G93_04320 [Nitrospinae bacterium RIFCSPLOWO2_12_FULL_45_22]|nr:MAG: hypothetical protein A3G93_04320 [Nitrospinae bacterium RIFCSPLOWO2_12_FULL_45_22]